MCGCRFSVWGKVKEEVKLAMLARWGGTKILLYSLLQSNSGFCDLSDNMPSVHQGTHFSPGHTGDHIPCLLILHRLDVVQGGLQGPEDGGIARRKGPGSLSHLVEGCC